MLNTHRLILRSLVYISGKGQISSPIETETNCFNGILKTNCSQSTGRAFVNKLNVGVKDISQYSDTNSSLCPSTWKQTVLPECCVEGIGDCYGEYQAIAGDPYVFHKDCVGKNKCTIRAATRMDTAYLNCDDPDMYPEQTSYFDVEFYCIDGKMFASYNYNNLPFYTEMRFIKSILEMNI